MRIRIARSQTGTIWRRQDFLLHIEMNGAPIDAGQLAQFSNGIVWHGAVPVKYDSTSISLSYLTVKIACVVTMLHADWRHEAIWWQRCMALVWHAAPCRHDGQRARGPSGALPVSSRSRERQSARCRGCTAGSAVRLKGQCDCVWLRQRTTCISAIPERQCDAKLAPLAECALHRDRTGMHGDNFFHNEQPDSHPVGLASLSRWYPIKALKKMRQGRCWNTSAMIDHTQGCMRSEEH